MIIEKPKRPLVPSQMGAHNRFRLLVLASLLIVGCSSPKPDLPKPVERDRCLDAGPVNSVAFNSCVAKREARFYARQQRQYCAFCRLFCVGLG
jgi:hypothetical protein